MMDLAQQPFTLAGSLWSCRWVYKHRLLRPVSDWERLLWVCVCVKESNVEIQTNGTFTSILRGRHKSTVPGYYLNQPDFFFISMHHFASQVSCLLAHCFGFNHSLLVLCYSQPSQHFSGGGQQFSEDQLKSNLLPVRHLLCTKQQTTSKHTAINIK